MPAPVLVAADAIPAHAVLADVRFYLDGRSAWDAYVAGHLPGAVFVDVEGVLSGDVGGGRHPFPTPEAFAARLGALGIAEDAHVVAYDDAGGTIAARLVWMLRILGADASLLDGGLQAWTAAAPAATPAVTAGTPAAAARPVETGPGTPLPAVQRAPRPWPAHRLVDADAVAAETGPVLDARQPERFRGEVEPVDPRAGHIPGARSVPTRAHLTDDGRFRTDLAALHADLAGTAPVYYCGSGVTACHGLLALELAGVHGRLYPGSWSDWSADPARPVATGSEPDS